MNLADKAGVTPINQQSLGITQQTLNGMNIQYTDYNTALKMGLINKNGMVTQKGLQLGFKPGTIDKNQMLFASNKQSGWDRWGKEAFNSSIALGGLALNVGSFIENRETAHEQIKMYRKQEQVLDEQLKESKEEYSRIKSLRKKLSASY